MPSPGYTHSGDAYFDLGSPTKLSASDEKAVQSLLTSLKGKWKGTLTDVSCTGPDRAPVRNVSESKADVTFTYPGGNYLTVKLATKSADSGISKQETLHLLPKDGVFDLTLGENALAASQKHRNKTANGGSRLVEIATSIRVEKDGLRMSLEYFSNGVFVHGRYLNLVEQ